MVITSQGVPYFCRVRDQRAGQHRPADAWRFASTRCPIRESRPRRIAITPDDVIYYSDYSRGYLGRFDTEDRRDQPSGRRPAARNRGPTASTYLKGAIWYSESAVKPNTLVRFDPATQKFQTWPIPSGGGVVRNMMPTTDGSGIVMACSGVNRIALAEVR